MTIEHSDLQEDNLHEVKYASTANKGEMLKGDGDGTSSFMDFYVSLGPESIRAATNLDSRHSINPDKITQARYTFPGVLSTDTVIGYSLPPLYASSGIFINAFVSADNEITIIWANPGDVLGSVSKVIIPNLDLELRIFRL